LLWFFYTAAAGASFLEPEQQPQSGISNLGISMDTGMPEAALSAEAAASEAAAVGGRGALAGALSAILDDDVVKRVLTASLQIFGTKETRGKELGNNCHGLYAR
jgi:hypothetical protein